MPANNAEELNEDLLNTSNQEDYDEDDDDDDEGEGTSEEGSGKESSEEDDSGEKEGTGESSEENQTNEESAQSEEEREAIREHRRQERKLRKQRAREREENFRRELAVRDEEISQMRQQLDLISRKNHSAEVAQLDNAINQAASAYEYYKSQLADGAKANDGAVVADATEKMLQARQAAEHYSRIKGAILKTQQTPRELDPRVKSYAKEWHSQNKWYDPSGKDPDSRIALAIDDSLVSEGFNPATKAYWEELSKRVKKYIPHRANMVYNENTSDDKDTTDRPVNRPKPKSIVAGSGRNQTAGKGEYQISAERKEALIEAGLWDNPKAREAAIKQFKEYDRIHGKA